MGELSYKYIEPDGGEKHSSLEIPIKEIYSLPCSKETGKYDNGTHGFVELNYNKTSFTFIFAN